MSDLISRSETMKKLREYAEQKHYNGEVELANGILKAICFIEYEENIPTAYDVEKVVAELEEMIKPKKFYFCKYAKGGCKHLDNDAKDCLECIVELSIDIVRKGGVE